MLTAKLLYQIAVVLVMVTVLARITDFLIGIRGRAAIRERLLFRSWYRLQQVSPLTLLASTARLFSRLTRFAFGPRLHSMRGLMVSMTVGTIIVFSLWPYLEDQLHLSQPIAHEASDSLLFGSVFWINPFFNLLSFAVTRRLSDMIATSPSVGRSFLLWLVDAVAFALIATATFLSVEALHAVINPNHALALWFGRFEVHTLSVLTAASAAVPSALHLLALIGIGLLAAGDLARRLLCLILERLDEENVNPLTIVTGALGVVVALLVAVARTAK